MGFSASRASESLERDDAPAIVVQSQRGLTSRIVIVIVAAHVIVDVLVNVNARVNVVVIEEEQDRTSPEIESCGRGAVPLRRTPPRRAESLA